MPSLVFHSKRADHEKTGDDDLVGEYSRNVAWYSGPVMITKGPNQPREPTAREVDELQAHANMMFFYRGGLNIELNTHEPILLSHRVFPEPTRHGHARPVQ